MKDPTRLLEASPSELERHLLRAGAEEQPPSAAMQRLADTLGVNTGVLSELAEPAAAGKLNLLASSRPVPLLPIGVVALGLAIGGVVWVANRPAPTPGTTPTPVTTQAPEAPASQTATAQPQVTAAEPTPDAQSLAEEIARIDAVRRLLAANQAKVAVRALRDYQHDFPRGVLQQEADVLSIEARQRAGDRRGARQLGSRFLDEHPDSPHSARVRELLEALGPDAR